MMVTSTVLHLESSFHFGQGEKKATNQKKNKGNNYYMADEA